MHGKLQGILELLRNVIIRNKSFPLAALTMCENVNHKRPTGLNGHLIIRDNTAFLSDGGIFAYQQPHYYNK